MLLFLFFVVIVNIFIYKSLLNPIILQSILWLIYFLILSANIESFDVSIEEVYYFLICQLVGFSVGGFIYWYFFMKDTVIANLLNFEQDRYKEETDSITRRNIDLLYPLFMVILCGAIYFILKESDSISLFDVSDLRETLTEEDGKRYGTYGFIQLMVSVYVLILILSQKVFSLKHKLLVALFFVYTYLLGSRGQFIFFLGTLFYVLLWQKKISKWKLLIGIFLTLLIMFLVTYSRTSDLDGDFLINTLLVYTTASLPALVIEQFHGSEIVGYHTFRAVYLWLNKMGFTFPVAPMLAEWTKTPLLTNVYSYIKPYYYDFGTFGIILIPAILGFSYNMMYLRAMRGKFSSLLMLGLFIYPMIMQTFDEQYFRWAPNWIYIYVLIKIITKVKLYGSWSGDSHL